MESKAAVFAAILAGWIFSTVACAVLPFAHAAQWLNGLGQYAPLLTAVVIGAVLAVMLSIIMRRLTGAERQPANFWTNTSRRSAAVLGVMTWGLPVGFVFALEMFMQSSDLFSFVPSIVIWPLGGCAYGLYMRWMGMRRTTA